ncbi:EF-hand calcium-binding domain-containing protein 14 isoform X2 [Rhincodon typus]|uniref:EF-hand calcium-binding domain-containing protein 14 isoform X2 n=1 Tax=Rhincodon typus TaxID=259920 RepID=UPI00202DC30B|nr:EF-hand calcium-binding domain-containing protein 14 isoform X2 [Rhincodon typus]
MRRRLVTRWSLVAVAGGGVGCWFLPGIPASSSRFICWPTNLCKLESKHGQLDVQYKAATPQKKMKKRKELNALIGLTGDGKKKKSKKGSGHQLLLRTEATASDSESTSEFDEFAQPAPGSLFTKGGYIRCCKICYPLCAFVMLAACVVACVGLVWMQVALKEDLDALKEKFRTLESSQKTSFSDIPKLSEDLLAVQKDLANLDTGDRGISKIWTNITELNKQISQLNLAVAHLKANVKSASDLINLPVTVEQLQKSVATIGSTLTSVQHDVDTVQTAFEDQKKMVDTLQQNKDILDLHDEVGEVNATLLFYHASNDEKLHHIDFEVGNLSQRVALLEKKLLIASNVTKIENVNGTVVTQMNSTQETVDSDHQIALKVQKPSGLNNHSSQMSNLRERLKVMVNALTSKPENVGDANAINSRGYPIVIEAIILLFWLKSCRSFVRALEQPLEMFIGKLRKVNGIFSIFTLFRTGMGVPVIYPDFSYFAL